MGIPIVLISSYFIFLCININFIWKMITNNMILKLILAPVIQLYMLLSAKYNI